MSTGAPSATAPAKKDFSPGCLMAIGAGVLIVVVGLLWNVVTGQDSSPARTAHSYDYPGTWPLTIDTVKIGCDGSNPWVLVGDDFYALTGAGKMAGYKDIDPIWAYDPKAAGLKVNIAPLRADALKLC